MSSYKPLHKKDVQSTYSKDADDSEFKDEQLGDMRVFHDASGQKIFQFAEVMTDTVNAGDVLAFGDSNAGTYLVEGAASTSNSVMAAGLAVTTCPVGDGCWIQIKGPTHVNMKTDNTVAKASVIYKDSTNAERATDDQDTDDAPIGRTFITDSGSVIAAGRAYLAFPQA